MKPSVKSPPSSDTLPADYPVALSTTPAVALTGATIAVGLGAIVGLWPCWAHQEYSAPIDPSAWWPLVRRTVTMFTMGG